MVSIYFCRLRLLNGIQRRTYWLWSPRIRSFFSIASTGRGFGRHPLVSSVYVFSLKALTFSRLICTLLYRFLCNLTNNLKFWFCSNEMQENWDWYFFFSLAVLTSYYYSYSSFFLISIQFEFFNDKSYIGSFVFNLVYWCWNITFLVLNMSACYYCRI